jgi:hypothetical protein
VNHPTPETLRVAESARTIALQMMSERGRSAVLVGGAREDAALEALLDTVLRLSLRGCCFPFPIPSIPQSGGCL